MFVQHFVPMTVLALQHWKKGRDWFWSALKANKSIYAEVLGAVMINIFALVSPLFVMNVYDRVVPNNATDTLWVLAAGVTLAYVFDFLLKKFKINVFGRCGAAGGCTLII